MKPNKITQRQSTANDSGRSRPSDEIPAHTSKTDAIRPSEDAAARMGRLANYVRESIAKPDGLEANIDVVTAGLMQVVQRMLADLEATPLSPTSEEYCIRHELVLKFAQRIEGFSKIAIKLRSPKPDERKQDLAEEKSAQSDEMRRN